MPTNLVENVGMGAVATGPGWVEWAGLQQQLAGENMWLFQAVLEQLVSTQTQANVWEAVTQSLEVEEPLPNQPHP